MQDIELIKKTTEPEYTKAGSFYPDSSGAEKGLSFMDNFGEPYELFKKVDGGVLVPRGLAPLQGKDLRPSAESCAINCKSSFIPRLNDDGKAEQARVVSESLEFLLKGESGIIQAATGFGKTYVGTHLACEIGLRTLITVTKEDIKGQWLEAIEAVTGLKADQVGLIQGSTCRYKDYPITICMIHSICKEARYPEEVYSYFGLHLVDEVQYMAADGFSKAMWLWNTRIRVGLSATPERKDGKDLIFRSHIGPVRVVSDGLPLTPKVLFVTTDWLVPRVPRRDAKGHVMFNALGKPLTDKLKHSPGKCGHITKLLGSNDARNNRILGLLSMTYSKGRNVVVFSDSLKHLDTLKGLLLSSGIPEDDIGKYVGGLKEHERDVAKTRRIVLATYQMCAVATNAPWWDTAILATPKSDVVQIAGRVIRRHEGKVDAVKALSGAKGTVPIIFDLVDLDSRVYKGYFKKRLAWYTSIGAPMINKPVI
jgi:superfamily II DNA or RNA helicase